MQTKLTPLTLSDGCELRYRPLPGLDVADYFEEHAAHFEQAGVFDDLLINGRGVSLGKALDLETVAVVGSAVAKLLSGGGKKLREHVIEHCARFNVEAKTGGEWLALSSDDAINEHLLFPQMVELVGTLAGGVLGPLFDRLKSVGEARRQKSATPSQTPSKES